jgi:hypothetical protein
MLFTVQGEEIAENLYYFDVTVVSNRSEFGIDQIGYYCDRPSLSVRFSSSVVLT